MPILTPDRRRARSHLASAAARAARRPDDVAAATAVTAARRDYYATALEDYIKRTIDAAPPLTDDQRARLAALLRPVTTVGGGRVA